MAWSWSHTDEAYRDAEENLRALPHETLREIWAEWLSRDEFREDADYEGFSPSLFVAAMESTATMDAEVLANLIWTAASDSATCDNGGFNAWMCPFGCGPHTVAFNREEVSA